MYLTLPGRRSGSGEGGGARAPPVAVAPAAALRRIYGGRAWWARATSVGPQQPPVSTPLT